jgi:hypothetical protein
MPAAPAPEPSQPLQRNRLILTLTDASQGQNWRGPGDHTAARLSPSYTLAANGLRGEHPLRRRRSVLTEQNADLGPRTPSLQNFSPMSESRVFRPEHP